MEAQTLALAEDGCQSPGNAEAGEGHHPNGGPERAKYSVIMFLLASLRAGGR